jgi:hypothetical protein
VVRDKTHPGTSASIAAMGLALTTLPVFVERGVIVREYVAKIARKELRYLYDCPQGRRADASGYKSSYYHFLDMNTGRRPWRCQLSTIDSGFLFAGALAVPILTETARMKRKSVGSPTRSTAGPIGAGRSRSWTEDARA